MSSLLAIASDPATPEQRLMSMIGHPDPQVRKALAGNANLPLRGLFRLMNEFPTQVLTNATMALLRMEDPWLFSKASEANKLEWAKNPEMPGWLLEQLAQTCSSEIGACLAVNPSTPVDLLVRLALPHEFFDEDEGDDCDDWREPRYEVLENPALPDALRFDVECALCEHGFEPDFSDVSDELADHLLTVLGERTAIGPEPEPEAIWGVYQDDEDESFPLLRQEETGAYVQPYENEGTAWGFDEVVEEGGGAWSGEDVRTLWGSTLVELVSNNATPLHLLRGCLRHPDLFLRASLARHPALGAEELVTLAQDREFLVRLAVASNPQTPGTALDWLAHDESGQVRAAVASNPRCGGEMRDALAQDERPVVRRAASRNTHHEHLSTSSF